MSLRRSFPRSNSSFFSCNGKAFLSSVLRLRSRFLVDAGLGTPRISMQDEPTGVPINRATRFENKVGSQNVGDGQSLIKERTAARFHEIFVGDGQSLIKERTAARFHEIFVGDGEPLILPRKFRQNRAWMELKKIWRRNKKVKGFLLDKVKGGYSVAIAGFITFLPFRSLKKKRRGNDRFTIDSLHPKSPNIVVLLEEKLPYRSP
uniref:Ribosomal protein S1 n=2 Tax=Scheuchzeria palustris TaxID=29653 RepID=A0A1Z1R0C3_9LILI|nr:ribosomal protein S1 [Scheuchzeria palustris]